MRAFIVNSVFAILLTFHNTSCAPLPSSSASAIHNTAKYRIALTKVERPADATERYGDQKISSEVAFEDEMISVRWSLSAKKISFKMQNKTNHSIKIIWDEAAYVDTGGSSHRVMHTGVKYIDRNNHQPPTVIVRKGNVSDIIIPTDNVYYKDGYSSFSSGWESYPLLLENDRHLDPEKFKGIVTGMVEKTMEVLLPLEIEEVVNDYIFTFTIISARIVPVPVMKYSN